MPVVAGIVCRLLQRRRAAAKPSLTGRSVDWGGQGWHKTGPRGEVMGLAGRGLAKHLLFGTVTNVDTRFGEACCRRGGVAGAEPPHKGGPNRPDRPELQFLVLSFQFLVVRGQFCASAGSELIMRWLGVRSDLRRGEVRTHFGMRPPGAVQVTRRRCWACGNYRGGWRPIRLTTEPRRRSSRKLPIRSRKAQPLILKGTEPTAVVETCEKNSEENAP